MSKIPTTIITGFLGSGKTTLIRHMIQNAGGRRIALIINEFGDVGVDGEVLKACGATSCDEDDIVELANGCICCTVAEDFIPTMEKLLSRPQRPDAIIIETSGLALPQPLVRAFAWPEIKTELTVDAVVTLVDAAAVSEGRFAADEAAVDRQRQADEMLDHETPLSELFEDQVACADLIVLSKSDLVDEAGLAAVEARIREDSRKGVKIIRSNRGALPIEVLIGQNSKAENEERFSHHELEHLAAGQDIAAHDHGHDEFETFIVELPAVADSKILLGRIEGAMRAHDILRLKGFAAISGKDTRLLIQAVGQRVESYFDRPWRASEKQATRLVVIGEAGLNRAAIAKDLGGNLRA